MSGRLAEILLKRGLITQQQLADARRHQLASNTRLGTSLVQVGGVRIDDISNALSAEHGVPQAEPNSLDHASEMALQVLSGEQCQASLVIPFYRNEKELYLAMVDPSRRLAGEIGFKLGLTVKRHVLPELRFHYYVEKHYQIARDPRFLRDKPKQVDAIDDRRGYVESTFEVDIDMDDLDEGDEWAMNLVSLDEYSFDLAEKEEPAAREALASALAAFARARTGHDVLRVLGAPHIEGLCTVVIFLVRGPTLLGCGGYGFSATAEGVQRVAVPLSHPSFLATAVQKREAFAGNASQDPLQERLASHLGAIPPGDACAVPVISCDEVTNVLVAHTERGHRLSETMTKQLQELAQAAGLAYDRIMSALL